MISLDYSKIKKSLQYPAFEVNVKPSNSILVINLEWKRVWFLILRMVVSLGSPQPE